MCRSRLWTWATSTAWLLSRALGIIAVGGAGYYAYTQGWLDQPIATLRDALGGAEAQPNTGSAAPIPSLTDVKFDQPNTAAPVTAGATAAASGLTKEEAFLVEYEHLVSGWAWRNRKWTAAMMWQESRGNPNAMGPVIKSGLNKGDRAHGLMQVMPITAQDMYDIGYKRLKPDSAVLRTAAGSIYFGTAYLQWLNDTYGKNRTWMTHAYNGGPGWTNLKPGSANYKQNQGYVKAITARHAAMQKGTAT